MKGPLEEFDGSYEEFDWNPAKREWTIRERGIDFADLILLFFGRVPMFRRRSDHLTDQGTLEERWQAIGPFRDIALISVVYTERNKGSLCWIISARATDPEEEEVYNHAIQS
jgi:uncharacterized DUF497 family protein